MRRALSHRDFRLLLAGTGIVAFIMPVQFITQIFWVQAYYHDRQVLYIGLIAACRGSSMLLFSLIGGAIADRFERRRVLLACETLAVTLSALVALTMLTRPFGDATILALLALTFAASGNMAFDIPARTASIPAIVGMKDLGRAISLQQVAQQVTFPLALPLVGFLNTQMEAGKVYALTLTAWLFILPLIAALRFRSRGEANRSVGVLKNIGEGMRYAWRHSTILAVISIIVVLQAVGMPGPATLGPVWMTNVLVLSKAQFGVMAMTWGLGTLAASFFFAWMSRLMRRGTTLLATTVGFAVCALVFAYSRNVPLTAAANFGLGFALIGTMVSATTIVQHTVSDEMRGRVLGLFPLAMSLSMLGGFPVSAVAQAYGMPIVYAVLAWAMLGLIAVVVVVQPALRRVGRGEAGAAPKVALALE
jgi:MFS family permease